MQALLLSRSTPTLKNYTETLNKTFLEEEERNSGKILPKIKIFLLIKRITFETIVVRKYG